MVSRKVSTNYNLERVQVRMLSGASDLEFELLDGGIVRIGKEELWTVFNMLASDEFENLCHHINMREDALNEAAKTYGDMVDASEFDSTKLYDYGHLMKRYGFHRAKAEAYKDALISKVGWGSWVDSCRVYESISGTHREWLD